MLDSNHSKQHILGELRLYADLVSVDSYLIATDGIMQNLNGVPRASNEWAKDNPQTAVAEFLSENKDFVGEDVEFAFNESTLKRRISYWPNAYLRRKNTPQK